MGEPLNQDTHEKGSSGTSFAQRWKHENLRLICFVSGITMVVTFLFFFLLWGTTFKSVALVVNGKKTIVKTNQWTVQKLLDEQAVSIGVHDRVSVPLHEKLRDGQTIVIKQATPIDITVDGETKTYYTLGQNVESALKDLHIELGKDDKLSLPPDYPVTKDMQLQITRVKKEVEEVRELIAYKVIRQDDPKLLKGKEMVVQEGREGVLLKKIEKVYEDGKLVSENVIEQTVQQESVNQIVAVGTQTPVTVLSASSPAVDTVTKDNVTFEAKRILNNVTLTAYTAGPASTGKSAGDPGYGVTSTGTKVTEGRTIAVDSDVIPLGWWVYIEGLGFRRAEDTGGSVKGNKIDVYFNSEAYAKKFGTKRGYKVYVIGPKKPAAN
mgnify:CR=1 FL=1